MDRASAEHAPSEGRLGLEWELWVVDKLSEGAERDEVIDALARSGLDRALASEKVGEIARSESFQRMQRRSARNAMAEQILRARRTLAPPIGIDSLETIDRERFRRDYWERSRPLRLTRACRSMRAVLKWSIPSLARDYGDVEVEVNVGRDEAKRRALTESVSERMRLGAFLSLIETTRTNERYIVSRNGLFSRPELSRLWDDLTPLPEILVPPSPPRGASLWVGPAGTLSPIHFDPHNVLLVQAQGRKRVRLVPPDRVAMFEGLDGYYATADIDDPDAIRPDSVLSVVLDPGDALFVPVGYFHEVTALEPSITLSLLCFPWDNDFHWITPVSSVRAQT